MAGAKLLPLVVEGAIDPVCGMTVNPANAKFQAEDGGRLYYFCCGGCLAKFQADPAKYLSKPAPQGGSNRLRQGYGESRRSGAKAEDPPLRTHVDPSLRTQEASGIEYTCPMHPEVRQIGPGSCPICGMALEPTVVTAEEPENEELVDMTRRFRASVVLTLPVVLLAMRELLPGDAGHLVPAVVAAWTQLVLATPVVLWGGAPFFARGWQSIVNRSLNMFADRARRGRRVSLQRGGDARAGCLSGVVPHG